MPDRHLKKTSPFQNGYEFGPQNFFVNQKRVCKKTLKIRILIYHRFVNLFAASGLFSYTPRISRSSSLREILKVILLL